MDLNIWKEGGLAIAVFIISFFSVVSGGIGLLTRPLLIFAGLPPAIAIGTFRVANLFSRFAGFIPFVQGKRHPIDFRLAALLFIPSLIGGVIGAEIVFLLDPEALRRTLALFILFIGCLMLLKKEMGLVDPHRVPTRMRNLIGFLATILIGVIAAFIGGSGILFGFLMIFNYQKSFMTSAPIRKITNFGSALSSSLIFMYHNIIDWRLMVLIVLASSLGEYLGARYQIKKGEAWVRRLTLIIVFASAAALFW